jgi:hypothetical protein
MPSPASRRCIAVPTPHSSETGLPARNAGASLRLRTAKPRGLSRSEAIFARNLLSQSDRHGNAVLGFDPLGEPREELGGAGVVQSLAAAEVEKRLVDR